MVMFDLKNADLSNINFSNADLGGADLNGANMTNTIFRFSNLSGVNFHGVNMQNIDLYGANLSSANMTGVILDGSDLRQSDISGADFTSASLVDVQFNVGVVTNGAMFTNATMTNINMSNMTLSSAVGFDGASLVGANFTGANLADANFYGANLTNANFTNATLTGANFTGATLTGAIFTGSINGPDSTTTTTSTTAAPVSCAGGGTCAVGDTGPGGGIVVYTSGSGSTKYMEVAPQTWYNSSETPFRWCYPQTSTYLGATGTAYGTGNSNTSLMRSVCTSNGAAYWLNIKNVNGGIGGKSDWFIPSKDELNYVCLYARQLSESAGTCTGGTLRSGFVGASYWTSSEVSSDKAWYQNFLNGGQASFDGYKGTSIYVRPVRTFGP
jgi:uncharacterized protein YjbI with pentapeptide repeats